MLNLITLFYKGLFGMFEDAAGDAGAGGGAGTATGGDEAGGGAGDDAGDKGDEVKDFKALYAESEGKLKAFEGVDPGSTRTEAFSRRSAPMNWSQSWPVRSFDMLFSFRIVFGSGA